MAGELDVLDWKRRVAALYAAVRDERGEAGVAAFRAGRDALFRAHPQSPQPGHPGLRWFPYDRAARVLPPMGPNCLDFADS